MDFRFRIRSFKSLQSDLASFQERGIVVKNNDGKPKADLTGKPRHLRDDQDVLLTQVPNDPNG